MSKVSIIIPVYNVEPYLDQCLESVIKQTYKNLEIIIINDGSTDNSVSIIKKYQKIDQRIIFINNYKNEGLGVTRNIGIRISTGEYLYCVDSDDWLELNAIELLVKRIEETDADFVICEARCFDCSKDKFANNSYFTNICYKDKSNDVISWSDIKKSIFTKYASFFKFYKKAFFVKNDLFF